MTRACDRCLAHAWLLARLAGHLDVVRGRAVQTLQLGGDALVAAVSGDERARVTAELARFEPDQAREQAAGVGLEVICGCHPAYPRRLLDLAGPPAVLHVAGGVERLVELVAQEPVAIVGARRASTYGLDVARALGRGLGSAGVTVLSGMALGVDSAAHAGALAAVAPTVAVLPCGADRPYPPSKRALHRQIGATGAVVAELPPGSPAWRWTFPARNRIIAALAALTIVVEAGERSGALITAALASELGRPVGAVPGRVTSRLAHGPNSLLLAGAHVIRSAQDALDLLYGAGIRQARADDRPDLSDEHRRLLLAIGDGSDSPAALARAGFAVEDTLTAVAALELAGYVRRAPGGRFAVVP
jgi:DNA processing protein